MKCQSKGVIKDIDLTDGGLVRPYDVSDHVFSFYKVTDMGKWRDLALTNHNNAQNVWIYLGM